MTAPVELIRLLEEISLNALPALQTVVYDGWLLRFANGYTGRANSVQTLYHGCRPLDEKIAFCEELYRSRGLNPQFKLTRASLPPDLDMELESRGYRVRDPVSVQTRPLVPVGAREDTVQIEAEPADSWLSALFRLGGLGQEWKDPVSALFRKIVPTAGFAASTVDGETAAIGLGVVERGWLGIYNVVTDETLRRQGHATSVMRALSAWGQELGAEHAYLQVTETNQAALDFYAKLGFREAYTYWYQSLSAE